MGRLTGRASYRKAPRGPVLEERPQYAQARYDPGPRPAQPGEGEDPREIWRDEWLPIVGELAGMGWIDSDIARVLGVKPNTFLQWKARKPALRATLANWRAVADDRVERALFDRATGYTYERDEVRVIDKQIVHVAVTETVLPDVKAAETWLFNRRSQMWRNRQDVVIRDLQDPRQLSDEELNEIIQREQLKLLPPPSGDRSLN